MTAALRDAAERGVDWWLWRLVVSQDIPDGLATITRDWSFADTLDGHLALDALEEVRAAHQEREREKAESKRRSK